jgi:hypothetical protein
MPFSRRWLLAAAVLLPGCHSRDRVHVETDEGPPRPATVVTMADLKTAPQLLSGFYGLEGKSWRWTARNFSVLLAPPASATQNGAVLKLQLSIPQPLIDRVKTTALKATVHGADLSPESFTQAGAYTFIRDVPANLFDGDPVKVDFSLDRFLPAGAVDPRELGLVVTSVGFEPRKSPLTTP